eukprot:scaffold2366_cov51-Phaeocystis_antarctica.AAC.1
MPDAAARPCRRTRSGRFVRVTPWSTGHRDALPGHGRGSHTGRPLGAPSTSSSTAARDSASAPQPGGLYTSSRRRARRWVGRGGAGVARAAVIHTARHR